MKVDDKHPVTVLSGSFLRKTTLLNRIFTTSEPCGHRERHE